MMFSINGWVEVEPSHIFSTKTTNWTNACIGTHIFWHNSRTLVFWNKETIAKLFLKKSHWNINVFDYRCNSSIFNNINTASTILPIDCRVPSVCSKK